MPNRRGKSPEQAKTELFNLVVDKPFRRYLRHLSELEQTNMSQVVRLAILEYGKRKHDLTLSAFKDSTIKAAQASPAEVLGQVRAQKAEIAKLKKVNRELNQKLNKGRQLFKQVAHIEPNF